MDKSVVITTDIAKANLKIVSNSMRDIVISGTFEKFNDEEKDSFNRMKMLLDNTIYSDWIESCIDTSI